MEKPLLALSLLTITLLLVAGVNALSTWALHQSEQQHDAAIRAALGATRAQLFGGGVVETALLVLTSVVAGGLLAHALGTAVTRLLNEGLYRINLSLEPFQLDVTAALFSGLGAVVLGLTFSLGHLVRTQRPLSLSLLDGRSSLASRATSIGRWQKFSVCAQVALLFVLLTVATTSVLALSVLETQVEGLTDEDLTLLEWRAQGAGVSSAATWQDAIDFEASVQRLAGVTNTSTSAFGLFSEFAAQIPVRWPEISQSGGAGDDATVSIRLNFVGPNFAATYGSRLIQGRDIDASDVGPGPAAVLANEALLRLMGNPPDPIGQPLLFVPLSLEGRIVGVLEEGHFYSARRRDVPMAFVSHRQMPRVSGAGTVHMAVRHSTSRADLIAAIQHLHGTGGSPYVLREAVSGAVLLERALAQERLVAASSLTAGVITLFVATIGLAATLVLSVTRRRAEIAVMMALGATHRQVARTVLWDCGRLLGGGIAIGVPLALGANEALSKIFTSTPFHYFIAIVAPAALIALVGLLSCAIAVRHASRLDPLPLLRVG